MAKKTTRVRRSFTPQFKKDAVRLVRRGRSGSGIEAFIWDQANGMRELDEVLTALGLDLTDWTLAEARGISSDGLTIVGFGINPDGDTEAWMATIPMVVPVPTLSHGATITMVLLIAI